MYDYTYTCIIHGPFPVVSHQRVISGILIRHRFGSTNTFDSDPAYTSRLFLSVCLEHVCASLYIFNGNVPRIITTLERKPRDVNFLSIHATRISHCMLIFASFFCILCCGPSKATGFVRGSRKTSNQNSSCEITKYIYARVTVDERK